MDYSETFLHYLRSLPDLVIYLLLGLSAFVENIFPPIPGDTITAFGAFLVGTGRLHFFGVYFSTTLGSLLGFLSLFGVGRYLGQRFFIERDFRYLKAKDILKAEAWFEKYGYFLIAFNRFLPGVRSAISVAGGISGLRFIWVTLFALMSCGVWNLLWILMGLVLGTNWEIAKAKMSAMMVRYNLTVLVLFGLIIALVLIKRRHGPRKRD
jgi:membrane protein DedA with SNARE-associated domain